MDFKKQFINENLIKDVQKSLDLKKNDIRQMPLIPRVIQGTIDTMDEKFLTDVTNGVYKKRKKLKDFIEEKIYLINDLDDL